MFDRGKKFGKVLSHSGRGEGHNDKNRMPYQSTLFFYRKFVKNLSSKCIFEEMSIPSGGIDMLCKNRSASGRFMDQLAATLSDLRSYYNINSSSVANNYTYYVELLRSTSADSSLQICAVYLANSMGDK